MICTDSSPLYTYVGLVVITSAIGPLSTIFHPKLVFCSFSSCSLPSSTLPKDYESLPIELRLLSSSSLGRSTWWTAFWIISQVNSCLSASLRMLIQQSLNSTSPQKLLLASLRYCCILAEYLSWYYFAVDRLNFQSMTSALVYFRRMRSVRLKFNFGGSEELRGWDILFLMLNSFQTLIISYPPSLISLPMMQLMVWSTLFTSYPFRLLFCSFLTNPLISWIRDSCLMQIYTTSCSSVPSYLYPRSVMPRPHPCRYVFLLLYFTQGAYLQLGEIVSNTISLQVKSSKYRNRIWVSQGSRTRSSPCSLIQQYFSYLRVLLVYNSLESIRCISMCCGSRLSAGRSLLKHLSNQISPLGRNSMILYYLMKSSPRTLSTNAVLDDLARYQLPLWIVVVGSLRQSRISGIWECYCRFIIYSFSSGLGDLDIFKKVYKNDLSQEGLTIHIYIKENKQMHTLLKIQFKDRWRIIDLVQIKYNNNIIISLFRVASDSSPRNLQHRSATMKKQNSIEEQEHELELALEFVSLYTLRKTAMTSIKSGGTHSSKTERPFKKKEGARKVERKPAPVGSYNNNQPRNQIPQPPLLTKTNNLHAQAEATKIQQINSSNQFKVPSLEGFLNQMKIIPDAYPRERTLSCANLTTAPAYQKQAIYSRPSLHQQQTLPFYQSTALKSPVQYPVWVEPERPYNYASTSQLSTLNPFSAINFEPYSSRPITPKTPYQDFHSSQSYFKKQQPYSQSPYLTVSKYIPDNQLTPVPSQVRYDNRPNTSYRTNDRPVKRQYDSDSDEQRMYKSPSRPLAQPSRVATPTKQEMRAFEKRQVSPVAKNSKKLNYNVPSASTQHIFSAASKRQSSQRSSQLRQQEQEWSSEGDDTKFHNPEQRPHRKPDFSSQGSESDYRNDQTIRNSAPQQKISEPANNPLQKYIQKNDEEQTPMYKPSSSQLSQTQHKTVSPVHKATPKSQQENSMKPVSHKPSTQQQAKKLINSVNKSKKQICQKPQNPNSKVISVQPLVLKLHLNPDEAIFQKRQSEKYRFQWAQK